MPGYLIKSKNHANWQRHTYSAIGQAVGVHLRTVPHWVAVVEHQGKEVAIEGGQRGALPGERRTQPDLRARVTDSYPAARLQAS
ncbi:hypothetical protein D3C84_1036740 [compost metagenome]